MFKKPQNFFVLALAFILLLSTRGAFGNIHPNPTNSSQIKAQNGRPPFETSMERGRYAQVVSIVESGNLNVDEFAEFLKPDLAWYNGHFYSTFPPGMAILSAPFYLIGRVFGLSQVFTYFTPLLLTLITVIFIIKTGDLLGISKRGSILSSAVFALATSTWAYSSTFSAHSLSALCAISIFYLILKIKKSDPEVLNKNKILWYGGIGFIYSINLFIDYPNLLILLPLVLFTPFIEASVVSQENEKVLSLPKKATGTVIGLILGVLLFVVFNLINYSKATYLSNTYTIKWVLQKESDLTKLSLSNEIFKNKNYLTDRFSLGKLVDGFQVLTTDSDRGVFQFYPIYIFALIGLVVALKSQRKVFLLPALIFLLNICVYGSYDDPWGGWAFGPRYLTISLALFSLLIGYFFDKFSQKILVKILMLASIFFSTSIAAIGALTTTAVPPSIEVAKKGIYSNYMYNFQYLWKNGSSSFIYNSIFSIFIPQVYYVFVCVLVCFLFTTIFFANKKHLHTLKAWARPFVGKQ